MIDVHGRWKAEISICFSDSGVPALQGYYFTGDGCKRDEDGYFWITGKRQESSMHRYQGSAESSMSGMLTSPCVLHSRTQSLKTLMCLCMPCQPFGGGIRLFAIHPSACPSFVVLLSNSFIICCETSV